MATIEQVLKHIHFSRPRKSVKLLDTLYGPGAKVLRSRVAALLLDRKVNISDPMAQYGRLRTALLTAVGLFDKGIDMTCIASEDAEFEQRANEILGL